MDNLKNISKQSINAQDALAVRNTDLPWITVAPNAPYFITETGENWTPIGQNDAITWPDLAGLFQQKNLAAVEGYLTYLVANGVTVLRLMLEYSQTQNRYFERPVGKYQPNMVKLWDDLFVLCARYNLRILLTPYDTFWMWRRWRHHPYNRAHGGPCSRRTQWLLCSDTLVAIKNRFTFVAERWGGSGVLFAWDLWNEIHPAQAGNKTEVFPEFISQLSTHVKETEMRLYGRAHLQTVSLFGPVLNDYPAVADVIFRHPQLDFATTHFYDSKTINNPKNSVAPAIHTGYLVREALAHVQQPKPFFDSEHGPIYSFNNRKKTLPEDFDDEYFRHMQWAHLASGGAGGGLRWPYRHPHVLTHGMRAAQKSLAAFSKYINWAQFNRKNLNTELKLSSPAFAGFACGDERQVIVWLLRQDTLKRGLVNKLASALPVTIMVPGLPKGIFTILFWDTLAGAVIARQAIENKIAGNLTITVMPIVANIAIAIVKK